MLSKILPEKIYTAVNDIGFNFINEIRIRDSKPIVINVLSNNRILKDKNGIFITAQKGDAEKIAARATEFSLYSVNNQIVQGFITINNGIRIGLCGEVVWENDNIKTIKNINSINIRIAHEIGNCAERLIGFININSKLLNTLIISPPGKGKTTMLRSICKKASNDGNNVLLIDERNEIAAVKNGNAYFDVGNNTDIITNSDKKYAFECGIRCMSPDVIITDEIVSESDSEAIINASASGIVIIASIHSSCSDELIEKKTFKLIFESKSIDRYVFLSNKNIGEIESVYDGNMKKII